MTEAIIGGIVSGLILLLIGDVGGAFSLPLARTLRLSWVRLATRRKPPGARAAKIAETESYVHELEEDLRRQGYTPSQIMMHMLVDLAQSIPADLTWRPQRLDPDDTAHEFFSPSELGVPYPASDRRVFSMRNSKGVLLFLHTTNVTLRGGKPQRIYYFSPKISGETVEALPEGRVVKENPRNGFLTISKMR